MVRFISTAILGCVVFLCDMVSGFLMYSMLLWCMVWGVDVWYMMSGFDV